MNNPHNLYTAGANPYTAGALVQESAREWSKLQLGALGFVGICGVLGGDSGSSRPMWLQDLSAFAALTGLVLALVAVTLVATAAFPLGATRPGNPTSAARRLRLGIGVTFIAVACTALSALSMWWPDRSAQADGRSDQVTVTTNSGSACGIVLESVSGSLDLDVDGERVRVPLNRLVSIVPVDAC